MITVVYNFSFPMLHTTLFAVSDTISCIWFYKNLLYKVLKWKVVNCCFLIPHYIKSALRHHVAKFHPDMRQRKGLLYPGSCSAASGVPFVFPHSRLLHINQIPPSSWFITDASYKTPHQSYSSCHNPKVVCTAYAW